MSGRRGVGLGAFDRSRLSAAQYASHGSALRSSDASALDAQLAVFRSLAQQFAQTHAREIRSNPSFRTQFARMCAAIGVDPLAASSRGAEDGQPGEGGSVWSQLLGRSVNDFYFELAVRVVEICNQTQMENGGLLAVREAKEKLMKGRMEGAPDISEDDILRAVATLKPLGSYSLVKVGNMQYIRSVPRDLNRDQTSVLEAAQALGFVTVSMLVVNLGWHKARAATAIEDLESLGMLWVDRQTPEWEYWSPNFISTLADVGS